MRRRIGLIVNPIAGMGGAVGLKGTDGDLAARAEALGAVPLANERLGVVLAMLGEAGNNIDWLTAGGSMGSDALTAVGLEHHTLHVPPGDATCSEDTREAAHKILDAGAELIVFVGGDGTAADLLNTVGPSVPILGVPAGVKMHSAVFAVSPRAAGQVICSVVEAADWQALLQDAEVMDRPGDEASPELLGYVRTPVVPMLVAPGKAATQLGSIDGACQRALERIRAASGLVLIGPGMTMRRIKQELGIDATLLGVEAWRSGQQLGRDLSATDLLELLDTHSGEDALLVVGIVGGQGFLFGRGNQQLSASVLKRIRREQILIVSSLQKLIALERRRLYVDTGNEAVDRSFDGFMPVIVGVRQTVQVAVGLNSEATTSDPVALKHG